MFVQVIRGKVKDPAGVDKQIDRCQEEIKPISKGYLAAEFYDLREPKLVSA